MKLPIPNPTVMCRTVSEGAVLLDTSSEVYFGLNPVGARIWALLPPASGTLDELCAALQESYPDVALEVLRRDVAELLDELMAEGLLAAGEGGPGVGSSS